MFCDALVLSHAVLVNQANGSICVYKRVCVFVWNIHVRRKAKLKTNHESNVDPNCVQLN